MLKESHQLGVGIGAMKVFSVVFQFRCTIAVLAVVKSAQTDMCMLRPALLIGHFSLSK